MSVLTSFYTFAQMENATIVSASSESSGFGAQHAIAPLEPNFFWQANESQAQHEIIIDLGELQTCDVFFVIHHEFIAETPVVTGVNLILSVSETLNAVDYQTITFTETDGSSYSLSDDSELLRVYVFAAKTFRYAKVVTKGRTGPNFYATNKSKIGTLWFGTRHDLDAGTAYPIHDKEEFLSETIMLVHGKTYTTGFNVNAQTHITRQYQVTETQYDLIRAIMRACNGIHRPFILIEQSDTVRMFCHFESDEIVEEIIDTEVYRITLKLIATPIVQKRAVH